MFTIRCSESGFALAEVELAATPLDFARLAMSIAALLETNSHAIVLAAEVGDPKPYDRCLTAIRVQKGAGPMLISLDADSLSIVGGAASLVLFSLHLPVEAGLPEGYHTHFERSGREEDVLTGSIPLVLCVAGDEDEGNGLRIPI